MSYAYYGFLSYKKIDGMEHWHSQVTGTLERYIRARVGGPDWLKLFHDSRIEPGANWSDELCESVDRSPVLIALCSPSYFQRPWCVGELQAFMRREEKLKKNRGDLIVAASVCDRENFPLWAQELQFEDFSDYYNDTKAFWNTEKSSDFSECLRSFSAKVCDKLRNNLPAYANDFPKLSPPPQEDLLESDDLDPFAHLKAA